METSTKGFWQSIFFVLERLKRLDSKLRYRAFTSFFLIFLGMLINIFAPIILRLLIRSFEETKDLSTNSFILILLFSYGAIWTIGQMVLQLRELIIVKVYCRVIKFVSLDVMSHLIDLSMRFHAFKQTGSVIGAIKQAQHAVPRIFWGFLFSIFPVCIEVFMASILISYNYGSVYGSIIISLFVIYFIFTLISSKRIYNVAHSFEKARQKELGKITDVLLNIETVKYFGNQDFEMHNCQRFLDAREVAEENYSFVVEQTHLIQGLIIGLGLMATIIFSGLNVINGSLRVSDFVMINGYILQFVSPFMALSKYIREVRQGVADLQGALQFLAIQPEISDPKNGLIIDKSQELEIKFVDVEFGYFKEVPILKNLSFNILANKMTAIVGATGTGKSTITKLLFRFYDATGGEILINGQNLKKYSLDSLSESLGVVPQGANMFNETLLYNLTYGHKNATKEELFEALRIAQLDNFVNNLPHGFETKVGENGLRLSGGERQRLAIARAILKRPKLFIFDEATSALDSSTEKAIQKSLNAIISEKITTLVIAHRLTTILQADQIVVLENGEVVEIGTHHQLLEKNGSYAKLWNEQFAEGESSTSDFVDEN